jgi:hypothetical protein
VLNPRPHRHPIPTKRPYRAVGLRWRPNRVRRHSHRGLLRPANPNLDPEHHGHDGGVRKSRLVMTRPTDDVAAPLSLPLP